MWYLSLKYRPDLADAKGQDQFAAMLAGKCESVTCDVHDRVFLSQIQADRWL